MGDRFPGNSLWKSCESGPGFFHVPVQVFLLLQAFEVSHGRVRRQLEKMGASKVVVLICKNRLRWRVVAFTGGGKICHLVYARLDFLIFMAT